MKYIVTNYGGGENYTPCFFEDEREAYEWFYTLIIENMSLRLMIDEDEVMNLIDQLPYLSVLDMRKMEVLKKLDRVTHGYVIGEDDDENVIQLFEIK